MRIRAISQRTRRPAPGWRVRVGTNVVLIGLLLAGMPTAGLAAGIAIAWDDCRSGGGAAIRTNACDSEFGVNEWFASFILDSPLVDAVGVIAIFDLQFAGATIPDWWALQSGGCRVGDLDPVATFVDRPGCIDPWADAGSGATALIQGVNPMQPRGAANQMRIYYAAAVPSAQAVHWAAGTTYHAARLRLTNAHTAGPGACAGCSVDACIVLNAIEIQRLSGPDVVLSDGAAGQNIVKWQGQGPDCAAVPIIHTSWGRLRTLYR